jgi:hypothetical protein
MNRRLVLHALVALGVLLFAFPALAGKGGNGNGSGGGPSTAATAGCTMNGDVVSATGLPTDQVINFMVTDSSGTNGWVLGYTPDGNWTTHVSAPNGATKYEFVSRTSGKDGANYTTFASCSV